MTDHDVFLACPACGSEDVPTLVVRGPSATTGGVGWRCRTCKCSWTDQHSRLRFAS
jgi:formate dehydrogenase maturation protein FdhE